MEVEGDGVSSVQERGKNQLKAVARDLWCSGVSGAPVVSATSRGVMGRHHRQQRSSSCDTGRHAVI